MGNALKDIQYLGNSPNDVLTKEFPFPFCLQRASYGERQWMKAYFDGFENSRIRDEIKETTA
jgi:hypothetical protein